MEEFLLVFFAVFSGFFLSIFWLFVFDCIATSISIKRSKREKERNEIEILKRNVTQLECELTALKNFQRKLELYWMKKD